jgi:ferredoxin
MKVFVESSVCRGHGVCEYLAPDVFRVGDHGFVEILQDPTDAMHDQVAQAAQSCPEGAIALIE